MNPHFSQFDAVALRPVVTPLVAMKTLPALIRLVMVFTIVAFVGGGTVFGYNLSGIAWVMPLAVALLILANNFSKISFPYGIWLPWALFLFIQLAVADHANLDPRVVPQQRTFQVLCPIIIGMAVSTFRPTPFELESFVTVCRYLSFVLLAIVAAKTGILLTGTLPDVTGLAPEVMTVMLLCSLFVNRYLFLKEKRDVLLWSFLAFVPFIAVTRTAIAAALLTFPLAFGPMRISRRIVALILIILLGGAAFYSPRVQKKMFYSGKGEVSDVTRDDFATSGRSFMWEKMYAHLDDNYLAGYGSGSGETFVYGITGKTGYPHNDWLLTLFDYGIVGVSIYAICLMLALLHAVTRSKYCVSETNKILFLTGASAIIPFCLMMTTDNIMVYASFFGNLHFTMLGLAYGALQAQAVDANRSISVAHEQAVGMEQR